MNKNLTAKIQKIENASVQFANSLSRCIYLEPDTVDLRLRKGFVYLVVNLESNVEFDTEITAKVIADILKDSYFQSESISPTQSLEKAISDVREKIVQTLVDKQTLGKQTIKLDVVGAVLWGNVLYYVQMGEGAGHLIRDNTVRSMNIIAEGNFATASGVAKDGDVLILATKKFSDQIPPNTLLTAIPQNESLLPGQACLVTKFVADTSFTEKEFIEFAPDNVVARTAGTRKFVDISGIITKVKGTLGILITQLKKPKKHEEEKDIKNSFETFKNKIRVVKVGGGPVGSIARKKPLRLNWYVAPIIGIVLIVAVVITAVLNLKKEPEEISVELQPNETTTVEETPMEPAAPQEEDTSQDAQNKVRRVEPLAFYDMKIVEEDFDAGEITGTENLVVVTDKASGKIYSSLADSPKFNEFPQTYTGIASLQAFNGNVIFVDTKGYHVVNLTDGKSVEDLEKPGLKVVYPYLDFIYTPLDDKIMKLTREGNTLTESLWAQSDDFSGAKDIVVAYSIYILKSDDIIVTYTSGRKDSFQTTGIDKPMSGAVQLATETDFDSIYVLDKGNRRVVQFDKNGGFTAQYKAKLLDQWNDLKGFFVTADEKTIYVLDGTIIYSFGL